MESQPGARFQIDEDALVEFVRDQVRLVSKTPLPAELAGQLGGDDLDLDAVWLGAGLATQIGLAILEHPEAFISPR